LEWYAFGLNPGFTLGASWLFLSTPDETIRTGLGLSIWIPRALSDEPDSEDFSDFNAYATIQLYPVQSSGVPLYIKGNLGFNLPILSNLPDNILLSGSLYFGIGLGVDFDSGLFIEILYNSYDWDVSGYDGYGDIVKVDCGYSNLALTLGIRF